MSRKSTGKRLRFEILKRDGFRCRYCGRTALMVCLQVDHVIAVANGGDDSPGNLVTACVDCNGGKSAVPLDSVMPGADVAALREHAEQVREVALAARELATAKKEACDTYRAAYSECVGRDITTPTLAAFRTATERHPPARLFAAMDVTAGKVHHARLNDVEAAKYFFAVLRNMKQEEGLDDPDRDLVAKIADVGRQIDLAGLRYDHDAAAVQTRCIHVAGSLAMDLAHLRGLCVEQNKAHSEALARDYAAYKASELASCRADGEAANA